MDFLVYALLTGIGATAVTDVWAIARKLIFGVPMPDYGLVGRWIAYMPRGKFRHDPIAASPPVRGEGLIGWTAHYLIGTAFAAGLLAVWGLEWIRHPNIGPALIVGVCTVAAPYFLLQPGMGAGIAASRTARPVAARFHSLVMHTIFGLGLYLAGRAIGLFQIY